jgi:methylmalonyl-CoA mutase C-terminal domain/subunit
MPVRVVLTKLGLDGHDRGQRLIARELRDRGAEVILSGIGTRPEGAARIAVQEDADVVAVSLLSGSHISLMTRLVSALEEFDAGIPLLCGGVIPPADVETLTAMGVHAFPVGTSVVQAADEILAAADGSESVA